MTKNKTIRLAPTLMVINTIMAGAFLSSSVVKADNTNVVDKINITVPISCTLEGTGINTHNATISNGQYDSNIGETTLKAFCNDNEGFAIYAIGYTDNLNGKNVLTNSSLGSTYDITTGTAINGNASNWAMKITTVSDPAPTYPITIQNSFDSFHTVPNEYTLVAKRTSGTDIGQAAEGSTLKTTYQAYISKTQAAGTYTGQVKYTLVHPHNEPTPPDSMLDIGSVVNAKMKSLAAGTDKAYTDSTSDIKAIRMANALPANFEATEANTVSTPDSKYPVYIFFDNTNDAGIIYFYTTDDTVVLNEDSRYLFFRNTSLIDISGLADWDASNVVLLQAAFREASSLTSLHGLENWDTSKLTNINQIFNRMACLSDISALSEWDTSNVTNMDNILGYASSLNSLHGLENWNTSKVTTLSNAFWHMDSLSDISALDEWDTGEVTNMLSLFSYDTSLTSLSGLEDWDTGKVDKLTYAFNQMTALSDISALAGWDTGEVTNMNYMFSGDSSLTTIDLSDWNTSNVTSMVGVFTADYRVSSINVSNWDTSKVTNMSSMFAVPSSNSIGDGQLTEIIGLGNWDVSNVTDMTTMFYGAGQMTHYDIANWDVSKVQSFNHMFCDNFKLESLDLSKWDVSSVKTMYDMFDDNYKLTTIGDVSHWNTASLIDIGGWLNGASSFVGNNGVLDLSGWNTSNLKSSGEVFRATKLQTIDLSGWDFSAVTNSSWDGAGSGIYYEYGNSGSTYRGFGGMFKNASLLNTIYVSQSGLNSFNTVVNNGVNTTDMWTGSGASGFTVKP